MKIPKSSVLAAFAAAGLASAALAQPDVQTASAANAAGDHQGMMQGETGEMMSMMNDPEMKKMMQNCMKIMKVKQEGMAGE